FAEVLGVLGDQAWFPDLILLVAELVADDRDTLASWFRHVSEEIEEWAEPARGWTRSAIGDSFSDLGAVCSGGAADAAGVVDPAVALFAASRGHPWVAGWKRILLGASDGDLEAFTKLRDFDEAIIALNTMARDGRLASMISDLIEFVALEVPIARRIEIDTPE